MNWRNYLTPAETERLAAIPHERLALTAEYRTIFERCRARLRRAREKANA